MYAPLACLRPRLTPRRDSPTHHFPIYEPSAERVAALRAQLAAASAPLNMHYDAAAEVSAKRAGFY
jgi:hypothetical protein